MGDSVDASDQLHRGASPGWAPNSAPLCLPKKVGVERLEDVYRTKHGTGL